MADSINGGIAAKAEVINDGSLLRIYKDTGDIIARTNPMVVTATTFLTFTKIVSISDVVAEETGVLQTLRGVFIEIETTVDGLDGVFNRYDLTAGRNEETDTELRQRYLESLAVTGVGTLDAIVAAVKRVQGVSDASGVENDTETTNYDGLHSKLYGLLLSTIRMLTSHKQSGTQNLLVFVHLVQTLKCHC
ncbi:baseplate assembly protein [Shigella phage vB_SflM_004]|nr:baseplate assembly protein [Shigella phage vB_SflM_004]